MYINKYIYDNILKSGMKYFPLFEILALLQGTVTIMK